MNYQSWHPPDVPRNRKVVIMDSTALPEAVRQAVTVKTAGATGVARLAVQGLLELVDDPAALARATAFLAERLTGYAPIWHIGRAVRAEDPAAALRRVREELDAAVELTVKTGVSWLAEQGGPVTVAPSSSIIGQILDQVGPELDRAGQPRIALAGADAIGPRTVLNIVGTRELAERLPTVVVTTSLKLVPGPVFDRLGAPVFEHIPLKQFAGVILDGDLLTPEEVGRRAAALRE